MNHLKSIIGMGISGVLAATVGAQSDFDAWIETVRSDGTLIVTPYCRSVHGLAVTYRLVSAKSSSGGTSRSTQSGRVDLKPGVAEPLSVLQLGLSGDDRYLLELQVFSGNQLMATVTEQYPPEK